MNEVTIRFTLGEEVTPAIFQRRITQTLADQGALRVGESTVVVREVVREAQGDYMTVAPPAKIV